MLVLLAESDVNAMYWSLEKSQRPLADPALEFVGLLHCQPKSLGGEVPSFTQNGVLPTAGPSVIPPSSRVPHCIR